MITRKKLLKDVQRIGGAERSETEVGMGSEDTE